MSDKSQVMLKESLDSFVRSDNLLLSFRGEHADLWVAAYDGKVVATDTNLSAIIQTLAEIGVWIPATAIRFMTREGAHP